MSKQVGERVCNICGVKVTGSFAEHKSSCKKTGGGGGNLNENTTAAKKPVATGGKKACVLATWPEGKGCTVEGCTDVHKPCKSAEGCTVKNCFFIHPPGWKLTIEGGKGGDGKITDDKRINKACVAGENCPSKSTTCMFNHKPCQDGKSCVDALCSDVHPIGRVKKCQFFNYKGPNGIVELCKYSNCERMHIKTKVPCSNANCYNNQCKFSHPGNELELILNQQLSKGLGYLSKEIIAARNGHRDKLQATYNEVLNKSTIDPMTGERHSDDPFVQKGKELLLQLKCFDEAILSVLRSLLSSTSSVASTSTALPSVDLEASPVSQISMDRGRPSAQGGGAAGGEGGGKESKKQISFELAQAKLRVYREIYRLKSALPALALRSEIVDIVSRFPNVVIRGQTGSGKSTQVTQYLAEMIKCNQLVGNKLICTQPRKLAAENLAARVSQEWEKDKARDKVGYSIGYKVSGMKKSSKHTVVEYQTEGTLLAALLNCKEGSDKRHPLKDVAAVILDEAHERTVTLDIIVGILKTGQLDGRWPKLKIVVTSATLDVQLFSRYLGGGAPVIDIPGRMFPVDIIYRPVKEHSDYFTACVEEAVRIHLNTPISSGDILVFLTGESECLRAM